MKMKQKETERSFNRLINPFLLILIIGDGEQRRGNRPSLTIIAITIGMVMEP